MTPTAKTLAGVRVLILEDNTGMREILWSMLTGFGCSDMFACGSVAEAIENLPTLSPDLAIVDYQLKDETGLAFLNAVRGSKDPGTSALPIIVITSHTQLSQVRRYVNAGADEILAKPVRADALYLRISAVVNHRRPYVQAGAYYGPDRRRKTAHFDAPKRRSDASHAGDEPEG